MIPRDLSKALIIAILFFSGLSLMASLYQQFIGKVSPCNFCLYQRYCLTLCLLFSTMWWLPRLKILASLLLTASLLSLFVIAMTHVLIQMGVIPDFCEIPKVKTIEEFYSLLITNSPKCSDVSLSVWGIPASGYLMLASLIFLILSLREMFMTSFKKDRPVSLFCETYLGLDSNLEIATKCEYGVKIGEGKCDKM